MAHENNLFLSQFLATHSKKLCYV